MQNYFKLMNALTVLIYQYGLYRLTDFDYKTINDKLIFCSEKLNISLFKKFDYYELEVKTKNVHYRIYENEFSYYVKSKEYKCNNHVDYEIGLFIYQGFILL